MSGILFCFYFIFVRNSLSTNSVDLDQMPHSAASDLVLHCLPRYHFRHAKHKQVKFFLGPSRLFQCRLTILGEPPHDKIRQRRLRSAWASVSRSFGFRVHSEDSVDSVDDLSLC